MLSGFLYYFDIASAKALPEIKIFIPVRYYARDDPSLARGILGWMEARGRGAFNHRYMNMLRSLSEHRRLEDGNGLQTFISCLFKGNSELDITTYLSAKAFHPSRLALQRVTYWRGNKKL